MRRTMDGNDIQGMLNALAASGLPSPAVDAYDLDTNGFVDMQDVPLFVHVLLE